MCTARPPRTGHPVTVFTRRQVSCRHEYIDGEEGHCFSLICFLIVWAGLMGAVQSEDSEMRKVGLWTLTSLPFKHADPRIVAAVSALSNDTDLDVRRTAVESAQFTASPGDELVLAALSHRLLVDEDFSVRRAAAEGIRKLVLDRHTFLGNACRVLEPHLPQVCGSGWSVTESAQRCKAICNILHRTLNGFANLSS